MRRFSQRNSLVTLSEINITPLLDLAFVLLIIFVITRPMLEGRVKMQLPDGSAGDTKSVDRRSVRLIEIRSDGGYVFDGKRLSLTQLESELIKLSRDNPKMTLDLRADKRVEFTYFYAVMDICLRNHISGLSVHYLPGGGR